MSCVDDRVSVTIEVRFGVLRMSVYLDGIRFPLVRERAGWTRITTPGGEIIARVRYRLIADSTDIRTSEGRTVIRSGLRAMSFQWRGRRYRVGSMLLGRVRVTENGRLAMEGSMGATGLRIDRFSTELAPIAPAIAVGLAHHAENLWAMGLMLA